MKKLIPTLALSAALFGLPAFAANLAIPGSVSVHSVNGERVSGAIRHLELEPGRQVIEVRYLDGFQPRAGGDVELVRSQPVYLTFEVENDQQLQLNHIQINSHKQARTFAGAPLFELLTDGERQPLEQVNHDQMMYQFAMGNHH